VRDAQLADLVYHVVEYLARRHYEPQVERECAAYRAGAPKRPLDRRSSLSYPWGGDTLLDGARCPRFCPNQARSCSRRALATHESISVLPDFSVSPDRGAREYDVQDAVNGHQTIQEGQPA